LLGCRDLARLDFRLDARGVPHFLECNPLPGLNPDTGDLPILSRSKLGYEELVQGVLLAAARRLKVPLNVRKPAVAAVHHDSTVAVAMAK
jgi:D-alanine-D-alanine ligase